MSTPYALLWNMVDLPYMYGCGSVAEWFGRWTCDQQVAGSNPSLSAVECNRPLTHTCASVTKQYNLVPANGQWCLVAGKVTLSLASHWLRVAYISGSPPMDSKGLGEGDMRTRLCSVSGVRWTFCYLYIYCLSFLVLPTINVNIHGNRTRVTGQPFWPLSHDC